MKVVDRVAQDTLVELLRTQLPTLTFGEVEGILASPIGRTLRNVPVAVLFRGTKPRRRVVPSTRIRRAFARLERELALIRLPNSKMKGRRRVPMMLAIFVRLVETGSHDLTGMVADVIKQIDAQIPGLELSTEVMGDVLRALALSSTGLVTRPTMRIWRVRLAELSRPTSKFYKRFCSSSPRPHRHAAHG